MICIEDIHPALYIRVDSWQEGLRPRVLIRVHLDHHETIATVDNVLYIMF